MRIFLGFIYGGLLALLIAIPLDLLLANAWLDPDDLLVTESSWRELARQVLLGAFIAIGAILGALRGWQTTTK